MNKIVVSPKIVIIGSILAVLAFSLLIVGSASGSAQVSADGVTSAATATPTCSPAWNVVPGPDVGSASLWGVAAISSDDVWTVGYTGTTTYGPLIMHWDGNQVSNVPIPKPRSRHASGGYKRCVCQRYLGGGLLRI